MIGNWHVGGFRVWTVREYETKPKYESLIYCESLDQDGPTLYSYMPNARQHLRTVYNRIELHYGECGNPSEYDPERICFMCHNALAAGWKISPLGGAWGEESETMYYVHYHCDDIEWVNTE